MGKYLKARPTTAERIGVAIEAVALVCIIVCIPWGVVLGDSDLRMWLFTAAMCLWVATIIVRWRIRRRNWALVKRAGLRLCLRCRYSLVDLEPDGTCPECGEAYTAKGLEEGWRNTYPVQSVGAGNGSD